MFKMMMQVNNRKILLHCPACGRDLFYTPESFKGVSLDGWFRCWYCKLDIKKTEGTVQHLSLVMEDEFID